MIRCTALIIMIVSALISFGCEDVFEDDNTYFAIGASDAVGIGAEPLTDGYAFRIRDQLDDDLDGGVQLVLVAIPAGETDDIVDELDFILDNTHNNPDIVTVLLGANDLVDGRSAADFEESFRDIFDEIFDETNPDVIVIGNVPDLLQLPKFMDDPDPDVTPERITAFNNIIDEVATEFGIPVIDFFSMEITDDIVFDDGFHPNDEGHQRIAAEFLAVIEPLLP